MHTTAAVFSINAYYQTSETDVVITSSVLSSSRTARRHTHGQIISLLQHENSMFIEPVMWPSNSPDLNPVDYAVCEALQQRIYCDRQFDTVEQLKQAIDIVDEWRVLS